MNSNRNISSSSSSSSSVYRMLLAVLVGTTILLPSGTNAQMPTLFTFPKGSNETHRTNVCDRFFGYANGTRNIRDALRGLDLSVGVVDQLNDVYIRFNEDGAINEADPGIFVIILDELARRAGFTWRNNYGRVLPPNGSNPETGIGYNWTDVLQQAVRDYDFSFAEWVHNQERRVLGISFPVGWYDASTILVQNKVAEVVTFDILAFLRPFSNEVWAMICAVFIASGILYWMIDKVANWGTDNEINSVLYDVFLATMTFTQHHMYWDPSGHGKRIFAFSASFWSLVLASAYTANLASFLVSQGQPDEIATSLAEVEGNRISLCVRANAAVEADLRLRYADMNVILGDDFDEIYGKLISGDCELLATRPYDFDQFRNNIEINPECSLQWVGRQDNSNKGGPATLVDTKQYCTSLITHVLEIHMNEMLDDNFIDLTWQSHLRNQSDHQCGSTDSEAKDVEGQYSLTIKEVGGIFVFHGALGVLSIIVALIEQWWKKRQQRKMIQEAGKTGEMEAPVVQPRKSLAIEHYQSGVPLQSIINEQRKPQRPSLLSASGPSSRSQDELEFNDESVLETLRTLQSEMEKLQSFVVDKRNEQHTKQGSGRFGA